MWSCDIGTSEKVAGSNPGCCTSVAPFIKVFEPESIKSEKFQLYKIILCKSYAVLIVLKWVAASLTNRKIVNPFLR